MSEVHNALFYIGNFIFTFYVGQVEMYDESVDTNVPSILESCTLGILDVALQAKNNFNTWENGKKDFVFVLTFGKTKRSGYLVRIELIETYKTKVSRSTFGSPNQIFVYKYPHRKMSQTSRSNGFEPSP